MTAEKTATKEIKARNLFFFSTQENTFRICILLILSNNLFFSLVQQVINLLNNPKSLCFPFKEM